MRKKSIRLVQVGSLLDDLRESAHKILQACIPATMSFWIDDKSIIRAVSPDDIPPAAESLIIGTYSIGGASLEYILDDLVAERRERGKSWLRNAPDILRPCAVATPSTVQELP
jgi:hypothetical protein